MDPRVSARGANGLKATRKDQQDSGVGRKPHADGPRVVAGGGGWSDGSSLRAPAQPHRPVGTVRSAGEGKFGSSCLGAVGQSHQYCGLVVVRPPKLTVALPYRYFGPVMEDLLREMGGRLWRNRQAACGALSDLLQGRRWGRGGNGGVARGNGRCSVAAVGRVPVLACALCALSGLLQGRSCGRACMGGT